jgi:DNA-binding MarR family transcriptional regulator
MHVRTQQVAHQFLEIIPLVSRVMAADLRQTEDPLNPAYFHLLALLAVQPSTLGDLAARQAVRKPTMSNTITTLEERGWVIRKRDNQDRRVVLVEITPRGQDVLNGVHHRMLSRIAEILEPLSEQKRASLLTGLEILREVFESANTEH